MKIGISVNGVLRNFFGKIEETHFRYFPPENGEDGIKVLDYDLEKWVTFPKEEVKQNELEFNPNFDVDAEMAEVVGENEEPEDIKLDKVDMTVTLEEFLYERCTLEIFGHAEETVLNAVGHLNNLIVERKETNPEDVFVLMSRELGLSIPSTMYFLAKTKSQCQNINFVKDSAHHWSHVRVMVTDHPDIIKSKPEDCIVIKLVKPFNEDLESDFEINSIKDLDGNLLNSVSEKLLKIQKSKPLGFTSH